MPYENNNNVYTLLIWSIRPVADPRILRLGDANNKKSPFKKDFIAHKYQQMKK